jgi:hypothetical protein
VKGKVIGEVKVVLFWGGKKNSRKVLKGKVIGEMKVVLFGGGERVIFVRSFAGLPFG